MDDKLAAMDAWLDEVCRALAVPREAVAELTPELLDLARDVAHGPSRPGTPLTLFTLGLSAGSDPEGIVGRVRAAIATVRAQLP